MIFTDSPDYEGANRPLDHQIKTSWRQKPTLAGQSHLNSLDLLGGSHHVEEEVVVPSGALDLAA
ncbi:MAG: hypothetical protein OXH09_06890, partial [Gammaproteobacteria bacterium]|nr:hypothetical protein [Gammaproteobacteria bacterium]